MKEDFTDFPNLSQVRESISKLIEIGFPKYEKNIEVNSFVKNISKLLTNEFGILLNTFQYLKNKDFNFSIYRVRELDSFSNLNLFREHSYPPLNIVGMGRCNFPKYPVFYCSNDAMTALIEVAKVYGGNKKKYCISK